MLKRARTKVLVLFLQEIEEVYIVSYDLNL